MQISSLLTRALDLGRSPLAKRPAPSEPAGSAPSADPLPPNLTPNRAARALQDVLSRYDVTEISPRAFSEMLHSLRQSGAITDEQFQELSTILTDLSLEGIEPDEELDVVKFCEKRLEELRGEASPALTGAMERRLEWLRKFAMIQSVPDSAGLDSLA